MALYDEKGELKYAEPREVAEMLRLYEYIIRNENALDRWYGQEGLNQTTETAAHVLLGDINRFKEYLDQKKDTEIFRLIELSSVCGRRVTGLEKRCRRIIEKIEKKRASEENKSDSKEEKYLKKIQKERTAEELKRGE